MALQIENLRGLARGALYGYRIGVRSLHGPPKVNEYAQTAVYPEIKSYKNAEERDTYKTKEAIRELKTVEEKMFQINRPKLYGWYSYMINPYYMPSDILDWSKFITLTKCIDGLPDQLQYNDQEDKFVDDVISKVGEDIEKTLVNEQFIEYLRDVSNDRVPYSEVYAFGKDTLQNYKREQLKSEYLIRRIHHLIQSQLALTEPHVLNSVEDHTARVEGFWFRGGIKPDKMMLKKRTGLKEAHKKKNEQFWGKKVKEFDDEFVNRPYDRALQILHKTTLQTRHEDPLEPFLPRDHELCTEVDVPVVDYDPRCFGVKTKCHKGTNIPGYWPQDNNRMGMLAYHTRLNNFEYERTGSSYEDPEKVHSDQDVAKGIFTNFAWTMGQAVQLGFSPLTELTFPLVSQSVNTDGRLWSFYAYQLNTCDLTEADHSAHTHQNLMWCHPTVQLYDRIEDGKVIDYSPDNLRPLIKMYLNKPKARDYCMTPYLDPERPLVTDHPDPYQRKMVFGGVRSMLANKKLEGKYKKPEIYMWEKVKLIDHNIMPDYGVARRRRWWHMQKIDFLGKNHFNPEFISSDQKTDHYIPKGLRPEWTRKKGLARRYNKYAPKMEIPMKEKLAVWKLPEMKYKGENDDW